MKILITSGGTQVSIDSVRAITNMSSGTLGSKLCKYSLENDSTVDFLMAKNSKSPFQYVSTFNNNSLSEFQTWLDWCNKYKKSYTEYIYKTYDDYQALLLSLCKQQQYDLIILVAAVSDYGVLNSTEGKISSKNNLTIKLAPLPKLISQIRTLQPKSFFVGFKLLVNSTEDELMDACELSLHKNKCDLVVGNDLTTLKQGKHKLFATSNRGVELLQSKNIAQQLTWYLKQRLSKKGFISQGIGQWFKLRG